MERKAACRKHRLALRTKQPERDILHQWEMYKEKKGKAASLMQHKILTSDRRFLDELRKSGRSLLCAFWQHLRKLYGRAPLKQRLLDPQLL